MTLNIHVICLALNEDIFIEKFISSLYPFVRGISIITQYDRDYYNNALIPDKTIEKVLNFHDPDGKIHLIVRRFKDETAARNHEMLSLLTSPSNKILSHGTSLDDIHDFYKRPDYFLIADADEIYDPETFPSILDYLENKKPRGMRITGYNYYWSWNRRVPISHEHFNHFGFIKAGILFKSRRTVNFNEGRVRKSLHLIHLPDFSSKLFGFIDCPIHVGVFHHGTYLGDEERFRKKLSKHSHRFQLDIEKHIKNLQKVPTDFIPTEELPKNIQTGNWPQNFLRT